jgi:hypothetical protein
MVSNQEVSICCDRLQYLCEVGGVQRWLTENATQPMHAKGKS